MRTKLDNILLGILWLLAATLGASFWFNTKYGFNIFSAPHWQYLAYLQASKSPVAPSFYISLGIVVFITIFGLYFLIQPKIRKIIFTKTNIKNSAPAPEQNLPPATPPEFANPDASEIITEPAPTPQNTQQVTPTPVIKPQIMVSRPPHLNLPAANSYAAAPMPQPQVSTNNNNTNSNDNNLITQIFTQSGYSVKKNPYINGWQPNLMAIGTNEVLWIGAIGATTSQVKNAIDKLNQIFSDTLEDVYIDIHGFSINAPDAQTAEFNDILLFNTIDDLGEYMRTHQNTPPAPDEVENFDAYSEYIDTVIGYIGNL